MKKQYFRLSNIILSAALMLAGCSSEEQFIEETIGNGAETTIEQFTVSANDYTAADEQTRTAITKDPNDANVLKFAWKSGDAIGVFPESGMQIKFPIVEGEDSKRATFDGDGWNLKPGMKYAAYYPFSNRSFEACTSGEEVPVSYVGQKQMANGSTSHLGKYDFMVAKSTSPNGNNINFGFEHVGSILCFELNIGSSAKTFTKLSLVATTPAFSNSANLNVFTGALTTETLSPTTSIDLGNISVAANGTLKVYMMIAAANLSGKTLNILLEDNDGNEYKIEGIAGVDFQREKAYKCTTGTSAFEEVTTATLVDGTTFNTLIKCLANRDGSLNSNFEDHAIEKIVFDCGNDGASSNMTAGTDGPTIYLFFDQTTGVLTVSTAAEKIILKDGQRMFYNLRSLEAIDNLTSINTSKVEDMYSMFHYCANLKSLNLSNFNTSSVTKMTNMFLDCFSLTSLDLSSFNTSNVTIMDNLFRECNKLQSIDLSNFNTSNVKSMIYMFYNCNSLTSLDLSSFDTSNVTDMHFMFYGCNSLKSLDLSSFNTSKVENMSDMFHSCESLTSLDLSNFDTSKVENMSDMFHSCESLTSLDLSNFNTSNVTSMVNMFYLCKKLSSLDISNFDTSNVTTMRDMFRSCFLLTSLDLSHFVTSKVTNMHGMFNFCESLTKLDICNFDTNNVTDMGYMFHECGALKYLRIGERKFNHGTPYVESDFVIGSDTEIENMMSGVGVNTTCTILNPKDLDTYNTLKDSSKTGAGSKFAVDSN